MNFAIFSNNSLDFDSFLILTIVNVTLMAMLKVYSTFMAQNCFQIPDLIKFRFNIFKSSQTGAVQCDLICAQFCLQNLFHKFDLAKEKRRRIINQGH